MKRKVRGTPEVGSKYERRMRNGDKFQMTVVEVGGKLGYRVGKSTFHSPSAAAKSVNGDQEVNGWRFWKID